jgi:hypothetical protein
MSADWIEDDIKRLEMKRDADHKAVEVARRKKQLEEAETAHAAAQLPAVFEQLLQAVEADVKLFNSKFPSEGQKHLNPPQRIGGNQFLVERKYEPAFWLNVTREDSRFSFICIVSSRQQPPGYISVSHDLKLTLDDKEVSVEEASQELLRPALAALYS